MPNVKTSGWLIVGPAKRSSSGTVMSARLDRITRNKPALSRDELAVHVTLTLPSSAFDKPTFSAAITVDENQILHPEVQVEVEGTNAVE